jgi:tRNA G18 (ribose-2'-O)-methylase SpoU
MGEVFAVPHARLNDFPLGLGAVSDAGFRVMALTPSETAGDIDDVQRGVGDKLAILLGTEGPGLTAAALDAAHEQIRIPMSAGVDSINVGTAAAVAFHTLRTVS